MNKIAFLEGYMEKEAFDWGSHREYLDAIKRNDVTMLTPEMYQKVFGHRDKMNKLVKILNPGKAVGAISNKAFDWGRHREYLDAIKKNDITMLTPEMYQKVFGHRDKMNKVTKALNPEGVGGVLTRAAKRAVPKSAARPAGLRDVSSIFRKYIKYIK